LYEHSPTVAILGSGRLGTKLDPIQLDEDEDEARPGSRSVPIIVEDDIVPDGSQLSPQSDDTTGCDHAAGREPEPTQSKSPTLRELLQNKRKVVFITGAGISTSAGGESFEGWASCCDVLTFPVVED
jgi:hypothetical protein